MEDLKISFLKRRNLLNLHLAEVNKQLLTTTNAGDLTQLQHEIQRLNDHYYLAEHVFEYYVDLLRTRSEQGMGIILKGADQISSGQSQARIRETWL